LGSEPVGHPRRLTTQVEPQLPVELPRARPAQQRTMHGKQINIEGGRGELRCAQAFQPVADLRAAPILIS
ncbi:MAG: hypothetical protein ACRDRQ_23355, partial [Pseudonocardiaceae bacterium]